MTTWPDITVIALRALGFIASMQAAGTAIFLGVCAVPARAGGTLRRFAGGSAFAAIAVVLAEHLLEPARMTASFAGVRDASLHAMLLASNAGAARAVGIFGLALVAWAARRDNAGRGALALIGAVVAIGAFSLMGHTSTHEYRWILSVLLLAHLLIAAFWFGSLPALWLVSRREPIEANAAVIDAFSAVASRLVPVIVLAGVGMAYLLLPDLAAIASPYGALLIAKLSGFAILIGLAGYNKLRLTPAIRQGEAAALTVLRRNAAAEWWLIATVLAITAIMTGLFSPGE